ncbi:hypothetical protein DTO212C5_1886 [Paecilomyces variotii]|nr:hypothetical protein DTO212C5_1886 [Paecilomyces variotii]
MLIPPLLTSLFSAAGQLHHYLLSKATIRLRKCQFHPQPIPYPNNHQHQPVTPSTTDTPPSHHTSTFAPHQASHPRQRLKPAPPYPGAEHQRRGLGDAVLKRLLWKIKVEVPWEEGKGEERRASAYVTLFADEAGRKLYVKNGFVEAAPKQMGMVMLV